MDNTTLSTEYGITNKAPTKVTPESNESAKSLVEKDFEDHHIFFNNYRFHNHLTHHILAAYSLGADKDRLDRIYYSHKVAQRTKEPPKYELTLGNWRCHLGDEHAYTDFANFFLDHIQSHGWKTTVTMFAFDPTMFLRLTAGIFHPLIHLGYGLEFQNETMVAEGLAMTAVHETLIDGYINFIKLSPPQSDNTLMSIFNQIVNDPAFDHITNDKPDKADIVVKEHKDLLEKYTDMWFVSPDNLDEKMKELYTFVATTYAATAVRPDTKEVRLNFALMHCLTSVYFLEIFTHHTEEHVISLLRCYLLTMIYLFIAEGRPKLNVNLVESYQSSSTNVSDWDEILTTTINLEDEHAVKAIRALYQAHLLYGHSVIFLNAAQLTVDNVKTVNDWYFSTGYDDVWQPHGFVMNVRDKVLGTIDSLTGLSVETIQLTAFKMLDAINPKRLLSSAE
ncbi:oxidoreductase [Acrasis kona]|uniref:Oxidoreductase n=1 Tax=Acrasis kona TaxID=1008807 RepID=A0AAW2ZM55_9EUKA